MEQPVPGERLERALRKIGLFLGPVVALVVYAATADGPRGELAALMALAVVWWMTEALPPAVVSLAVACGVVLTGLATPKEAFGAFGYPLLYLFVGSFFIAEAMKVNGLGERLAARMGSLATTRRGLLIAISITAFALSLWMSNAAATAILLPIALPVAAAAGDQKFGAALVLSVAWGASVGGIGTPVGTPPNLIGLAEIRGQGHDVGFLEWMAIGVPIGLVMMLGMVSVLWWLLRVEQGPLPVGVTASRQPWSAGERSVMVAFAAAIAGWLTPTIFELAAPGAATTVWIKKHLTEEVVALIAGCSLFVLPGNGETRGERRPALIWAEAVRIDWGVIMLFAGGVLLGSLADKTGLSKEWGTALADAFGTSSTWSIVILVTFVSIVLSETTSNTATATLMAPLAGELAQAAGAAPVPAVLGATLGASFGFMLPISTGPNAMAYGTGKVRVLQMMRAGIVFDVVGFVLIVVGLRLICPLLGLA